VAGKQYYSTTDPDCKVEFHGAITSVIPLLIEWFGSSYIWDTDAIAGLIGKLANRGEWQLDTISSQLIRIAKLSIAKQSQAQA
jgi:hypothetical protein